MCALSQTEKFLLLAAYIASHNHPKFDLCLFGSAGKRARIAKKAKKAATAARPATLKASPPKAFPQPRLLAILYFIAPTPTPSLLSALSSLAGLAERQLLTRISTPARLDLPKYRCTLSRDHAAAIARHVQFDLAKYLSINIS